MEPEQFDRFTARFTLWAQDTPEVIGLVAVGSSAGTHRRPDRWSNHDLLVVARPGATEGIRSSTAWLPDHDRVAVAFNEPDHGLTAIYDDGHLIEIAVAERTDIDWFRADSYRVLMDDGEVAAMLEASEGRGGDTASTETGALAAYHRLLKELVIALGRLGRGELFSAHQHLHGVALPHLLTLIQSCASPRRPDVLDPYDPSRRFEIAYPGFATTLTEGLSEPRSVAAAILDILRTSIIGHLNGASQDHLRPVENLLTQLSPEKDPQATVR